MQRAPLLRRMNIPFPHLSYTGLLISFAPRPTAPTIPYHENQVDAAGITRPERPWTECHPHPTAGPMAPFSDSFTDGMPQPRIPWPEMKTRRYRALGPPLADAPATR